MWNGLTVKEQVDMICDFLELSDVQEVLEINAYEMVYEMEQFDDVFCAAMPSDIAADLCPKFNHHHGLFSWNGFGHIISISDLAYYLHDNSTVRELVMDRFFSE